MDPRSYVRHPPAMFKHLDSSKFYLHNWAWKWRSLWMLQKGSKLKVDPWIFFLQNPIMQRLNKEGWRTKKSSCFHRCCIAWNGSLLNILDLKACVYAVNHTLINYINSYGVSKSDYYLLYEANPSSAGGTATYIRDFWCWLAFSLCLLRRYWTV